MSASPAHLQVEVLSVTVSMRVMSAGKGYQYLLRSVAVGDGDRTFDIPLTRYYSEAGAPPGFWVGKGVAELGGGVLSPGDVVTEEQLARLLGAGVDPVTGVPLGSAYRQYAEGARTAVAGFDLTFSVPKSVSVLWGLADGGTQAMIVEAHHAAVLETIDLFEREVASTRAGHDGVMSVDVVGIAATAFDHWDSRAGDPQLHTHVVVSNKVKTVRDGRWRTLDSRELHGAVVALSEHYNALLADRLTGTLGVVWESHVRGADRSSAWEIRGVGEGLLAEFSSRTKHIDAETERLVGQFVAERGRRPSAATFSKLRAQATLTTRPPKELRSLADLVQEWRARAARHLGDDPTAWARAVVSDHAQWTWRADEVPSTALDGAAAAVVDAVSTRRATWRHWNLWAEADRKTMGWRMASAADRERVVDAIVGRAERSCVALTPEPLAPTPASMVRHDGGTVFRARRSTIYTSPEVLGAEDRLLALAADRSAPRLPSRVAGAASPTARDGAALSGEQAEAIALVAGSGYRVDLLVGPAGTGKTTAMRGLLEAWTSQHGRGSVVGLAPSAAAARALADDLGVRTDNTAKWLYEHQRGWAALAPGQLVIIDEASLADTRSLVRIADHAQLVGAKVLLVGDWGQLQSVDAGGGFALLAGTRHEVAALGEVHRFTHGWERSASLRLRNGEADVVDAYVAHGRVREGTTDGMIDAAYAAWRADVAAGRESILVSDSAATVVALNARARAERIIGGETSAGRAAALHDGLEASAGDHVVTRRNDRRLRASHGTWVRNGDRWLVVGVRRDGGVVVRSHEPAGQRRRRTTVVLPPSYAAEHLELGYAVTAHRAQGRTVDTAHVVVGGGTTRENLYVAMTRGRDSNVAYVALDAPDESHATPQAADVTARAVLHGVLGRSGIEPSAHQAADAERSRWGSIAQLAAEYEAIAAEAQRARWERLMRSSGLRPEEAEAAIASPAMGALGAALRRAEAQGVSADGLVVTVVSQRTFGDADDVAAVLHHRVERVPVPRRGPRRDRFIVGLVPEAVAVADPQVREALERRRDLIEARARILAHDAVTARAPWVRRIGQEPVRAHEREKWFAAVVVIAAYRDRYGVTAAAPLGHGAQTECQERDRNAAAAALRFATTFAEHGRPRATVSAGLARG